MSGRPAAFSLDSWPPTVQPSGEQHQAALPDTSVRGRQRVRQRFPVGRALEGGYPSGATSARARMGW